MSSTVYQDVGIPASWKAFSQDYATKVFSTTSFGIHRLRVLQHVTQGRVVELGCGPLGLMLRELAGIPKTEAIGVDCYPEMLLESARKTTNCPIHYVLGDNRCLPFRSASIDTIIAVNSFIPETRAEVELMFAEVSRVLRKKGRLVAVLPSFEMSLMARDQWGMTVRLDLHDRREWDTLGWQCFYTNADIKHLMRAHHFTQYRNEKMIFSAPEEVAHIKQIYAEGLKGVPHDRLLQHPLFEHLLIAER